MNFGALVDEVQANLANTDSSVEAQIKNWINWAVRRMVRLYDWSDLVSLNTTSYDTVVSAQTVSLASTVKKIYDVRYVDTADDAKCRQLVYRPAWFQNKIRPYPAGDATNTPKYYWVVGSTLYLNPIPDAAKDLYILLHSWSTDMSADANSPSLTNVDDVIVAGAVYRAYMSLPQLDAAEMAPQWKREFDELALEANLIDRKKGGWRAVARKYDAYVRYGEFEDGSLDPTADPLIKSWN